uniref:Membrane protein, putative n=1 Tax=Babesia bovis TaxID=5865 RepID=S6CAB3_BABBO|nr:membrane protein, putative [Babesia bovis]
MVAILLFYSALAVLGILRAEGHTSPRSTYTFPKPRSIRGTLLLRDVLNSINNNFGRKINIAKRFNLGKFELRCSLRSRDIDSCSRLGNQLVPINFRGYSDVEKARWEDLFDEVGLDATIMLDSQYVWNARLSVDIPRAMRYVAYKRGDALTTGLVDFSETIKRIAFLYKHKDLLLQVNHAPLTKETTFDILKRWEDLYVMKNKYIHVTPKLQLIIDDGISPKSNMCLAIERGKDFITPIIYPLDKKFELMAEKTLTDGIKANVFWSKDNRVYMNLSISLPWGKRGWQTLSFRFVFPEVNRSHVHLLNEVYLP